MSVRDLTDDVPETTRPARHIGSINNNNDSYNNRNARRFEARAWVSGGAG